MSDGRFEKLVDEHSRLVLNVALRVLGNAELAQDVHQEVFLAIWRRWGKFNGDTKWNAYLYRAAVRKSLELARREKRMPVREPQDRADINQDRPDGPMRTAELQQRIQQCLARLPRRQAEVFVLARIEKLPYPEIARVLDCCESTVKVHLHRAVKRLAGQLAEFLE